MNLDNGRMQIQKLETLRLAGPDLSELGAGRQAAGALRGPGRLPPSCGRISPVAAGGGHRRNEDLAVRYLRRGSGGDAHLRRRSASRARAVQKNTQGGGD